jgi:hypothetical protein
MIRVGIKRGMFGNLKQPSRHLASWVPSTSTSSMLYRSEKDSLALKAVRSRSRENPLMSYHLFTHLQRKLLFDFLRRRLKSLSFSIALWWRKLWLDVCHLDVHTSDLESLNPAHFCWSWKQNSASLPRGGIVIHTSHACARNLCLFSSLCVSQITSIYLYLGGKGHYVTFTTLYRRAVWTCPDGVVFL